MYTYLLSLGIPTPLGYIYPADMPTPWISHSLGILTPQVYFLPTSIPTSQIPTPRYLPPEGTWYQRYLPLEGTWYQRYLPLKGTWYQRYLPSRRGSRYTQGYQRHLPSLREQIDRHLSKHYLPTTTVAGGN